MRVPNGKDPLSGQPRFAVKTVEARTKTAALAALRTFQAELDKKVVSAANLTVDDLMNEYVDIQRQRKRSPTTIHETERARDKVISPVLGKVKIADLSGRTLDLFYRKLGEGSDTFKKQSPTSIQRYHALLSAALNIAVAYGWLDRNPAEQSIGRPELEQQVINIPTREQVFAYLGLAWQRDEHFAVLTLLAVLTASRRGEFCALRWTDIDAANGVVRIRRALYRAGDEQGEKTTKGRRERWVPINDELGMVLAAWRVRCEQAAAERGIDLVPDAFIVSKSPDGARPVNPGTLSSFQRRIADDLGIKLEGRNPFRHFGGSEIAASGLTPREGAEILGHADPAFFLRRYTHSTDERTKQAAAVLGRVFEGTDLGALIEGRCIS